MGNFVIFLMILFCIFCSLTGSFLAGFILTMLFTNDNATDSQMLGACWITTAICLGVLVGCLLA